MYHFQYREFSPSNLLLDQEKGAIPGLKLTYSHLIQSQVIRSHVSLYSGSVDYTQLPDSSAPHQTDTNEQLINLGLKLIPQDSEDVLFKPFIGFQYWQWDREIETRNGVQGLDEVYRWFELELGIKLESEPGPGAGYWLDISVLSVVKPVMTLEIYPTNVKFDLGSGSGYRIRAGKSWVLNQRLFGSVSLFTEYWEFGRSKMYYVEDYFGQSSYLTEPRSESLHSGIEISFNYRF